MNPFTPEQRHALYVGYCAAENPRIYIDQQAARHHCDRQLIREAIGLRTPDPTRLPPARRSNDDLFPATIAAPKPRQPPKPRKPRVDPAIKDKAIEAMRSGASIRMVGERYGLGKTYLQHLREEAGLVKPYGPRKNR